MTHLALVAILLQTPGQTPPASPAEPPPQPYKISGVVFGDYYAFAEHHDPKWDGQHGFWLRRLYLTYDHTLSPALALRARLEANSNGKLTGGTLNTYIKDLYLRWNFSGRQAVTIGLQPSLTWDYLEGVWGLRHVEKSPLDLYRWDSSRDLGVTLAGPLNADQTIKYAVQYGNESGTGSEVDEHKGFRASARYEPKQGFTAEVMLAQFTRANDADRTTAQVFTAYRGARGRVGVQYALQKRRAPTGDTDLDIVSAFGVIDIEPKALSLFARVDRVGDACLDCPGIDYLPIAATNPFTFVLGGIDYAVHPSFRVSPNVEWVVYSDRDGVPTPKNGLVPRLTFYWNW